MIGLIGLGVMGWRIGANLANDKKLDIVWDRNEEKRKEFAKKYNVKEAKTPQELVQSSDIIISMLADDNAVNSVISPLVQLMKGKILIDMSTISPSLSVTLANKIKENGGVMYDAPVIGTSVFVEQKKITVLVGGPKEHFDKVKDLLSSTSSNIVYMGDNGFGLYSKLVNNLLLGAYAVALAEAYNFGIKSGLDKDKVAKVLMELSSAKSPTSEIKTPKMVSGDYSTQFATKHMRKDLEIIQREAQNLKVITPMSSLALQFYRMAEALGYSESDYISVIEIFKKLSPS
ncbi:3-hydroxyisobutyrate dehydrogenase [Acidianus hospitalis W1]|jgi:3-hydroxyisobutyrate dehydrogenase|uniref:3-hydroxyisobutyrate dehydrogenase n=1 Tax=Acidianus hospitalis (strain W1) TaxID=933801 RepID=F4B506_ACIHW|nr:NAD(P)-dependent oxidoreductase [Acidianus hospitalis]AEE94308.1 3-hydroxyisobutyrate dehydrogenase [Acidianus hospitalis W1]